MANVRAIILAAGEGSRMRSATSKVLHRVGGRTLVGHVVEAARSLEAVGIALVVAPAHESLRAEFGDEDVVYAVQPEPRGTGDAAAHGMRGLFDATTPEGLVIVINGDCPGIRGETLRAMIDSHGDAAGTFLTVELADPTGYGRMIRDQEGALLRIVEEADADEKQRAVREVNAGIYVFDAGALADALDDLRPDNVQCEIYLTDTLEAVRRRGGRVNLYRHDDVQEVHGVNTRAELARAEDILRRRKIAELMAAGVSFRLPETTSVDVDVEVGNDTVIYGGVTLEAGARIGSGCTLYPHVRIARSRIGDRVVVRDGTVIEDSVVENDVGLGPYARLRPGARVCQGAHVGNFVEMKKTTLGRGSKAGHLTYLGDAEIGEGVNIGAGTITCNYDGVHKHTTEIGDGAFIGSNTALVAPVKLGRGAYVGAGSTITKNVADDSLAVARGRQIVKEGWARQRRSDDDRDES